MALRRRPEDFTVIERLTPATVAALAPAWSEHTPHVVYQLEKTTLGTPDAIAFFAKALGVKQGQVDYAGLKDKHAKTSQHCSVRAPTARAAGAWPASPAGSGWVAKRLGYSPEPILASAIVGNTFSLTIRDLATQASDEMTRRAKRLALPDAAAPAEPAAAAALPRTLVFTNYFGSQRFGSNRHHRGWAALPLIRGEFIEAIRLLVGTPARKDSGKTRDFTRLCAQHWEVATQSGDWRVLVEALPRCPERRAIEALAAGAAPHEAFAALPAFLQQMCVEAFQSSIWNDTARRLISTLAAAEPSALLSTDDDFGPMHFLPAAAIAEPWRDLDLPLLAPGSTLDPRWATQAEEALAAHGVTLSDLRVPKLRRPFFGEAPRPFIARAEDFVLSRAEPDPDANPRAPKRYLRTATFTLGRGAYATVVMRALGQ
jgi:tRNA pseudouridine13 synthase